MNIPKNGRIAIVDNEIAQALPLMQVFSRFQLPYVFYKGADETFLPREGEANNDIRILFLDINLISEGAISQKQIKSTLYAVINRIISAENYPYLLIYWSRHESEHAKDVEELFANELKDRAPINFLPLQKSDFFDLNGNETTIQTDRVEELFTRITNAIGSFPAYDYLLGWENLVHSSADKTLEEIFQLPQESDNWEMHANYIFNKLGNAFSGKVYRDMAPEEKTRSSLHAFNFLFADTLEYAISNTSIPKAVSLVTNVKDNAEKNWKINKKLLTADEKKDKVTPGIVSKCDLNTHNFSGLMHGCLLMEVVIENNKKVFDEALSGLQDEVEIAKTKSKVLSKLVSELKDEIKKFWIPVEINVTPICDFVQGKQIYARLLPGILVPARYRDYFNDKSEAVFISPICLCEGDENKEAYFLALDFRFLYTVPKEKLQGVITPLARIRQQLLTEIQSKLGRHVNRQGILFLD